MTVTFGSWMYFLSRFSISRASWVGVLPAAMMSSISGTEILPSGRTDDPGLAEIGDCDRRTR